LPGSSDEAPPSDASFQVISKDFQELPHSRLVIEYSNEFMQRQAGATYEKSLALNPKNWELFDRLNVLREKQTSNGQ